MFSRRTLTAGVIAGALSLPATAAAMPIDNGTPAVHHTSAPPSQVRTVVQSSDDTLPLVLAGAALLVAMASAGYSAIRVAPLRT
jgi:hypothetical protein